MKKIFISIILFFIFSLNINASTNSINISCPLSSQSNKQVECTISMNTISNVKNVSFNIIYSYPSIYESFNVSNYYTSSQITSSSISVNKNDTSTGNFTLGVLKINMPNDNVTIALNSIIVTNENNSTNVLDNTSANIRVKTNINSLIDLEVVGYSLSPTFDKDTLEYSTTVLSSSNVVSILATKLNEYSEVSGLGNKNLEYGINKFNIVVNSELGNTKTYKITITRPDDREKINTLSTLSVSDYNISPTFKSSVTSYSLTVPGTTTNVYINATKNGNNSYFVSDYGPRKVNLEYGSNKVLIKVNNEAGETKVYTINITRPDYRSTDNYLSSLSVSAGDFKFDKNTLEYTFGVQNSVENITVYAESVNNRSIISGLGSYKLKVGKNSIKIDVQAENGNIRTYVLNVNRSASDTLVGDILLNNISIVGYDIVFDPNITIYNITIDEKADYLTINCTPKDENTVINIVGNESLVDGSVIRVTAKNDSSLNEYVFNISKTISNGNDYHIKENKYYKRNITIAISSIIVIIISIYGILSIKKRGNYEKN